MEVQRRIRAAVKAQVTSAGPRYTPQIEKEAPNIQIAQLIEPLACLAFDEGFRSQVSELLSAMQKEFPDTKRTLSGFFKDKVRTPKALCELLQQLNNTSLDGVSKILKEADIVARQCRKSLSKKEGRIWNELTGLPTDSAEDRLGKRRQSLEYAYREFRKASAIIEKVTDFLSSPARALLDRNVVFIEGGWGTGKTHTLCDIALSRMEKSKPVYFVLGKNITGPEELTRGVVNQINNEDLFGFLDEEGRKNGQRSLVIVDGINEGDRTKWITGVASLVKLAKRHPYVGLVLSVRSPFQHSCVPEALYYSQVKLQHHGFEDAEFDAQKEFFHFYNLNLPEVPILRDEFSRPLVLKIVCEKLANMTTEDARRDFVGITSGQMGMTYIFEGFIKKVGRRLEDDNGLPRNFCWQVIKEFHVNGGAAVGIAKSMAEQSKDYISYEDAVNIFFTTAQFQSREAAADFLRFMVSEGLLIEGVHSSGYGENYQQFEVIQLPYQKFSDHIIARWLLKNHLDVSSLDSLRRCFYSNRPLGKIFLINKNAWPNEYTEPGLAEALMIEFPTRLRGKEFDNKRELIFYLPKDRRLVDPSYSLFLDGLYWRRPEGFGDDTNAIVRQLLSSKGEISHQSLDVLLVLALKPNHPYDFRRLHRYLASMKMADRDKYWGEYLRKAYVEQSPWRLIEWLSKSDCSKIPENYVPGLINVFGWLLTTVDRHLRDVTTRSLVLLGLEYPRQLFKHCYRSLRCNDPYVPERLLAACYGVTMIKWHGAGDAFACDLNVFARLLYRKMFHPDALYKTHHVLMRDYALGVIAIAHKCKPKSFDEHELENLVAPFSTIANPFPEPEAIDLHTCAEVESAIHMDFENYTVGRLIDGRRNYDMEHGEYQGVMKQIQWRMADLGYNSDSFEKMEQRDYYRRGNDEGSKIDRYGKKYSLIAYFEMFGWRQAHSLLSDYRQNQRTSDCDLDPTFIVEPDNGTLKVPDTYSVSMTIEDWLEGFEFPDLSETLTCQMEGEDWIAIDAYLKSDCKADDRSCWVDVRAFLVGDQDVHKFQSLFSDNIRFDDLIRVPEYYYTYFGETSWAATIEADAAAILEPCSAPRFSKRFTSSEYVRDEKAKPVLVPRVMIGDQMFREEQYEQPGEWVEKGGIECSPLAFHYTWESYHSRCNEVSGIPFLSTSVSNLLGLGLRSRKPELHDRASRIAVKPINLELYAKHGTSNALLLRRDLADQLTEDDRTIVLLSVGMKDIKTDSSYRQGSYDHPRYPDHICDIFQSDRNNIYQLYTYKGGNIDRLELSL